MSINNHPEFHQNSGNLMLTATKVMEMCANAGVLVTDNDLMWKLVSGLTDGNCTGDSKLFYVLQKRLIAEMIMDALTLDAQTVSDLEEMHVVGVSPLQFNLPQGATGGNVRYRYKPDVTAHFTKRRQSVRQGGRRRHAIEVVLLRRRCGCTLRAMSCRGNPIHS